MAIINTNEIECCGTCNNFINQDNLGFGICKRHNIKKHCEDECNAVKNATLRNETMTAEQFQHLFGRQKGNTKTPEWDKYIRRCKESKIKTLERGKNKVSKTDVKTKKVEISPTGLSEATKKRSKFRNVKTEYNGIIFDSKKECEFYKTLEFQKKVGIIKDFVHQHTLRLEVNGILVCKMVLDFKITKTDNTVSYVDIKAFDKKTGKFISTPNWKIKKKLAEAIYTIKIILK